MTEFAKVLVGDLFEAQSGRALFIRDYMDANPGPFPVYSASLARPFGFVSEHDYDGTYLSWVMNGYGGRVQELAGRFSASRDRGVLVPRAGVKVPDLAYLRFAMEPQLVAAAVGRRVDGRLNEYTKIYPTTAEDTVITLPIDSAGDYDYKRMVEIGAKLRRVEELQAAVGDASMELRRAEFVIDVPGPSATLSLADGDMFDLSIGRRVLRSEHTDQGVPVFSANANAPFGRIETSNLCDFTHPSLLWGIDGNFGWNRIGAGEEFATTDHCGRLQILDDQIDSRYVLAYLKVTAGRYGFDRVFRASLANIKADVSVVVPLDSNGQSSMVRQHQLAAEFEARQTAQKEATAALTDVLRARMTVEL